MHALGIPTTRALGRGEHRPAGLSRDGAPGRGADPGRGEPTSASAPSSSPPNLAPVGGPDAVRQLADYTIARHYPELAGDYRGLLDAGGRPPGRADRALAAGRLHPRRDEHRQHGGLRRDHRLRALRLHGRLRPGHRVQLDRPGWALRLWPPAADGGVEPGAAGRGAAAAAGLKPGGGARVGERGDRRLCAAVRAGLSARSAPQARAADGAGGRRGAGGGAAAPHAGGRGRLDPDLPPPRRRGRGRGGAGPRPVQPGRRV